MHTEVFEIVVKGTLSLPLIEALEGFTVTRVEDGNTYLLGEVPDQARLQGVLAMLADLTVELISVNRVDQG
ncbi:hypothetical protein [Leifsonia sp. PS1209]|uniref:hypothetical protein n=1 Tax=Leifsonia sp. PS1209 TaxID=2724914 RepID=UPI001442B90F|nr:hypothetical protein [Leifsonia sp. PS1209]QIZ99917.1 hypothetical protein HF024_16325 [Leifsonia sp. PS1209]